MMNNFLEFIKKDIEAKKTIISTMPTKTKTNINKYNEKVEQIEEKYEEYRTLTRNYLLAKSKSFQIKEEPKNIENITKELTDLEHVRFLLNPFNTYFEKMGFDTLLYQLSNYYTFNFNSLNEIINGFLDKFELAGICLNSNDFNYTCYVNEYMTAFLEVRYKKTKSYERVSEIFEQIYWANPEIIGHIELNFRKLIRKNEKKFANYIAKLQKDVTAKYRIPNYGYCLEKLQGTHLELALLKKETISDIIKLSKDGTIDIEQYLETSKARKSAFDSLLSESFDIDDKKSVERATIALEKLQENLEEYEDYLEFKPLFDRFKEQFEKLLPTPGKKPEENVLRKIEAQIIRREEELEKMNRSILGRKGGLFNFKNYSDLKRLKTESVYKAKELYELYKKYDEEYFKDKVMRILNKTLSVSDLLNLYESFDQYKKLEIQKVYNITNYDEIIEYSNRFDKFAGNPANIIVTGVPVFEPINIAKVIVNKYALNSIHLAEEELTKESLKTVQNKISLILRIFKIKNSQTNVDRIWFMTQVHKIRVKEKKEKGTE